MGKQELKLNKIIKIKINPLTKKQEEEIIFNNRFPRIREYFKNQSTIVYLNKIKECPDLIKENKMFIKFLEDDIKCLKKLLKERQTNL